MKIQLSEKRIIPDAITVWSHEGPEVDIVMDLRNLTFRPGSLEAIYAVHVLDHIFPHEQVTTLKNWYSMLAPGAFLHSLQDNFEYISRAFVGGDIEPALLNELHANPSLCTKEWLVPFFRDAGFDENNVRIWLSGAPEGMEAKHYEFILSANRHGK